MRVTDTMIFDNASRYSGEASSRMAAATEVASSGLRVTHPGDDPSASGLISSHHQAQKRAEAIGQVAGRASDELGAADGALGAVSTALAQARQLAVQFANDSYNASDRAAAAGTMKSLIGEVIASLNSKVGDRYLFGGSKDNQPPFDSAGGYQGDALVRQIEVAPGVLQDVSVRADVAISGAGGGTDVLATLQGLATALSTNNLAGIQSSIDGLTQSTNQVSAARATAGGALSALDAAQAVASAAANTEKTAASHLEDADVIDSATRLQLAQRALEASLQASAQSFQLSLLGQKLQ